jgi:hypothetical protein
MLRSACAQRRYAVFIAQAYVGGSMDSYSDEEASAQPRRRFGCLWGCLIIALLLFLATGGTIGYVAWNMYQAIHSEPRLQAILQTVHGNAHAQTVLGNHYTMMEVEHRSFPVTGRRGMAETYKLVLIGSTGKSFLDVRLEPGHGGMKLVSMVLTGPHGEQVVLKPSQHRP